MLFAILEICLAFLCVVGLTGIGMFAFYRWLLPLTAAKEDVITVVRARGDGLVLDQTVRTLLFLQRSRLYRGKIVLLDCGLDSGGRALAQILCSNTDEVLLCDPEHLDTLILDT